MNESEPNAEQPIRLTATEQVVLERLEHEELDTEKPRLARTYRRLIELSRSTDEVDAVLAAHLGPVAEIVDGDGEARSSDALRAQPGGAPKRSAGLRVGHE